MRCRVSSPKPARDLPAPNRTLTNGGFLNKPMSQPDPGLLTGQGGTPSRPYTLGGGFWGGGAQRVSPWGREASRPTSPWSCAATRRRRSTLRPKSGAAGHTGCHAGGSTCTSRPHRAGRGGRGLASPPATEMWYYSCTGEDQRIPGTLRYRRHRISGWGHGGGDPKQPDALYWVRGPAPRSHGSSRGPRSLSPFAFAQTGRFLVCDKKSSDMPQSGGTGPRVRRCSAEVLSGGRAAGPPAARCYACNAIARSPRTPCP
jgi:hypothetical protein